MESYHELGNVSEQEIRQKIRDWFPEQANLYAVLDFGVCFGLYDEDRFLIGIREQKEAVELEWKYLLELRIFNEEKELRLVPSETGWTGRLRRDPEDGEKEYHLDEYQKLWGHVKKGPGTGITGWSLLTSERGTAIQIPMKTEGTEATLHVRRYMRIPDVKKGEELVFQKDIRMVRFYSW